MGSQPKLWEPRAAATGSGVRQAPLLALLLILSAAAHAELGIDAHLANPAPWLREEVLLTVEVLDDRSIIEQSIAPWTPPGVILRPLGSRQERLVTPAGVRIRHRHLWAVMPLYPGVLTLQPPTVEVRVNGGGRLSLTPPALQLAVRPLDPILPVDIPVGPLQLTAMPLPEAVPRGRPFTWSLTIEGQGLTARGLERWLLESLRDTGSLRAYPLQVRVEDKVAADAPLLQRASVQLTFEPQVSGQVTLPKLQLPYIDPFSGQPALASLPASQITVQHPLWLRLQALLPALVAILLALTGTWRGYTYWRRWRAQRCWLARLAGARTPRDLYRAWHADARPRHGKRAAVELQRLEAACYGRHPLDEQAFQGLKARLITLARQAHKPD